MTFHVNYSFYPLLIPRFCQILPPPSNDGIIHSPERSWMWSRMKTHTVSEAEISVHVFGRALMRCGLCTVVHPRYFLLEGLTHRRHVKPAVPSQAWKRYIFQRTVACANIGVESSLAWRPSPLHHWREAPHLKHVLRVNIRQDKLPRKQLEGG